MPSRLTACGCGERGQVFVHHVANIELTPPPRGRPPRHLAPACPQRSSCIRRRDMGPWMTFSAGDLSGEGTIAGVRVRCLSVEMQFRGHTGYELPERQIPDLELLRERFGAERPK